MFEKMYKAEKFILLFFLIIYVGTLISWIFKPLQVAFQTIFVPLVLASFLFYLLRPFVNILSKKLSKSHSIAVIFVALIAVIFFAIGFILPILQNEIISFTNNIPNIISAVEKWLFEMDFLNRIGELQNNQIIDLESYIETLTNALNNFGKDIITGFGSFLGSLANVVFILLLIPIILFYVLKDSDKFTEGFISLFHKKQQEEVRTILADIDSTLSSYIQGQGIVCLFVGVLCLIAYLIIGLDYALFLAIIAGVTNIIPYFGPWIGSVPAVAVAIFTSPTALIITIIAIVIIQQIESNFISPQVIGKKLNIHPITIIFLILIAGRLSGLIGMILAVPFYATFRVIITHGIKIWRIKMGSKSIDLKTESKL